MTKRKDIISIASFIPLHLLLVKQNLFFSVQAIVEVAYPVLNNEQMQMYCAVEVLTIQVLVDEKFVFDYKKLKQSRLIMVHTF